MRLVNMSRTINMHQFIQFFNFTGFVRKKQKYIIFNQILLYKCNLSLDV